MMKNTPDIPDENQPCEAGIFALTDDGWTLLQRREYPNMPAALRWMRSRTNTLAARHPQQRFRASAVPLDDMLTLEMVLADYEAKRNAGDPQFNGFGSQPAKADGSP